MERGIACTALVLGALGTAAAQDASTASAPALALWTIALAAAIGASVALVELISRYRDEPFRVVFVDAVGPSTAYVSVHGLLAAGACWLVVDAGLAASAWEIAITAGFGAALIVRSRVFNARISGQDVAIGPGFAIDKLLSLLDQQIDRRRAMHRMRKVRAVLRGADYAAVRDLVATTLTDSRQTMSSEDQRDLANHIREIDTREVSPQLKTFALGFVVLDFMGEAFLDELMKDTVERAPARNEEALVERARARGRLVKEAVERFTLEELRRRAAETLHLSETQLAALDEQTDVFAYATSLYAIVGDDRMRALTRTDEPGE